MNKEIDWHGKPYTYAKTFSIDVGQSRGIDALYVYNRLAWAAGGDGAWPKPIYPEPPCGWDERDALV